MNWGDSRWLLPLRPWLARFSSSKRRRNRPRCLGLLYPLSHPLYSVSASLSRSRNTRCLVTLSQLSAAVSSPLSRPCCTRCLASAVLSVSAPLSRSRCTRCLVLGVSAHCLLPAVSPCVSPAVSSPPCCLAPCRPILLRFIGVFRRPSAVSRHHRCLWYCSGDGGGYMFWPGRLVRYGTAGFREAPCGGACGVNAHRRLWCLW